MTQEEKWILKYNEVVDFIETNHRNPSKHRIDEHDYLNWLKAAEEVDECRDVETGEGGEVDNCRLSSRLDIVRVNSALCSLFRKFKKLLEMTELYRRKNQYE